MPLILLAHLGQVAGLRGHAKAAVRFVHILLESSDSSLNIFLSDSESTGIFKAKLVV